MGRTVVPVQVEVTMLRVHARDEREWVVRGLMESVLEGERRGDAAANVEAVRGLKRKRVVEDGGESCRVWLEEFVKGEKVTCMPCRHVFHEGCIKTWLGTCHVCPIC
ncbi:E3 ubiquitin-protein ligase MPSR1-like [Rhododendron vialii]|uniref:E3 ubiquitin-protein ligase MPSR1-like n=1 Tax=Rhododendron vialii TaxID=182163 RepID=UPI00265DDD00|nr:E3 ubiquitin-protein ligase MPSR1-like [Rhododendron vialii]